MTPTVTELLNGCILTLMTSPRPEDTGMFAAARIRLTALVNRLVALECADGTAVRVWENAALRALIAEAGPRHGMPPGDAMKITDGDYSLAALDAANARLRSLVMRLHEAAEQARDTEIDRKILKLYCEMARRRELHLAPIKPVA
ncbi:MAG: hypothetical protein K2X57_30915 [Xanthobacteraceae bacterium]|nr:hypothetical protein [Xanthobacteraceae bacterium]